MVTTSKILIGKGVCSVRNKGSKATGLNKLKYFIKFLKKKKKFLKVSSIECIFTPVGSTDLSWAPRIYDLPSEVEFSE